MGFGNNIGLDIFGRKATYNAPESADFDAFLAQLHDNIPLNAPLFLVNPIHDMWDEYLATFPCRDRQEYNCNCCKHFIRNYGNLVYIDTITGQVKSAIWDSSKDYGYFNQTVRTMENLVNGRNIDRQFFTKDKVLGRPTEGGWSHLYINAPASTITEDKLFSASEVMAQSKENFRMLNRALDNHSVKSVNKALVMLRSDQLIRPEKVIAQAEWFADLQERVNKNKKVRTSIVWAAVSAAPKGFCNINSSAFGSLVEDIPRMSEGAAVQRFNKKMDPLLYRRPQSAPGAQNIKRGEEIFKKMGLERSRHRRYARLNDLQLEWTPRPQKAVQSAGTGIFANVQAKGSAPESIQRNNASITTMTFAKFEKKILPHAESIKVQAPSNGSYASLCAPVYDDAPNILQWSNPISWYVYGGGSSASQWGLHSGQWVDVIGICLQPNMWTNEAENQGESAFFLLEGCRDTNNVGMALFPEILSSELHEVRKTIESFSRNNQLHGRMQGDANGIKFGKGARNLLVKVVSRGVETTYKLDRMD
ncbi:hypothetical protein VPHD148_0084 [Vibrio phage D148]